MPGFGPTVASRLIVMACSWMYGLVGPSQRGLEPRYRVGSLESGALLCRAYEAYLEMHKPVSISFEHAWFLLLALARHDEVGISRC